MKAAVLYFALVFSAGFVLGPVRLLWAVPRFGTRTAELMEMPIMLVVTIVAARWVIRRLDVSPAIRSRLVMGGTALGLLLLAEFGLVLRVRGLTWAEYFASRDPVSGTAYYLMLGVVALLPLLLAYTEKPVHGDEG